MKHIIVLIILPFFLLSCNKMITLYYGVKDPKIENYDSLNKYLDKKSLRGQEIYVFKDTTSFFSMANKNKELMGIDFGFPESYFFNSKGLFIPYKESTKSCNAGVNNFLLDLNSLNPNSNADSLGNLKNIFKDIINLETLEPFDFDSLPKADYYVVMSWTKYLGKINDEHTFEWFDIIKSIDEVKIIPIFLNCDFIDIWGVKDTDLPTIE